MKESIITIEDIPVGKAHPITRQKLMDRYGLNSRQLRLQMNLLGRSNAVCNDQDGLGYYQPTTAQELRGYIKQEEHRALSTLNRLDGCRLKLLDMEE